MTKKKIEKSDDKTIMKKKKNEIKEESIDTNEKKKYSFGITEVVLIMTIMTLFGLFLGSFVTSMKYTDKKVSCTTIRKDMYDFSLLYDNILNEYYKDVDREDLLNAAINGMISSLDDPYALFLNEENSGVYDEELNGEFVGFGIELIKISGEYPIINKVYDNGPAMNAGIMANDVILEIDYQDMKDDSSLEIIDKIKSSKKGDTHHIKISREDVIYEYDLDLNKIVLDSVTYSIDDSGENKIGIITISSFAKNTYSQFKDVYEKLKYEKVTHLIIDLRNNTGGYLSGAVSISSMFLDKGSIIYQRQDNDEYEKVLSEETKVIDIPVVFVVNKYTASASEVMVSSLKDNLNSLIIGEKTFGKGAIQKLYPLNSGGYAKYTTQLWISANGNEINGVGINPDIFVENIESLDDTQLKCAIEEINKK